MTDLSRPLVSPPFTAAELAEARRTLIALPFFSAAVPLLIGLLLAVTT